MKDVVGWREPRWVTKSRPFLGWLALNLGGLDRLYPRVTIETLPDNVLLEIFKFYLGKDDADEIDSSHDYDRWQMLVHVCCRWWCIIFASPHHLDLKLYCTWQRSVNLKTLDIWPALPIVIYAPGIHFKEDVTNAIAALKQPSQVCKISYRHWQFQDPSHLLEEFATIDKPFLALTSLELSTFQNVLVFPDSFLGGYAPCLRSLHLDGIPYLQSENYFHLPLTLSGSPFCTFPILYDSCEYWHLGTKSPVGPG